MAGPLLLHVGYHKTATTWMQQLLFTPAHGFRPLAGHREAQDHVIGPHGLTFDPAPMRAILDSGRAGLAPGEAGVFSSEILSGHPFYGGTDSDVYARRLHRIAPDARVLISIRSQMRILPSVYMQYLLRGGTMTARQFFEGETDIAYPAFRAEHFEYDRLIALYQELFGRERVMVLTQESLKADMDGAVARLAAFAGATAYAGLGADARRVYAASYPEYAVPVLRRVNHVQAGTLNPNPIVRLGRTPGGLYKAAGGLLKRQPFKAWLTGRTPVTDYVKGAFAGRFSASNARLRALVGPEVDLTDYK